MMENISVQKTIFICTGIITALLLALLPALKKPNHFSPINHKHLLHLYLSANFKIL